MEPVRAQVAVLSVAGASGSVAIESIVADALTAAGHQIASFESVKDGETAIRSQLVGWIEDPDIDLVLVIGDGAQTSKAMAPLVDQPLPGFADLLRMLAFQEIGASAMLSTAEAAKCKSTFVFVLPSSEKAVRAAMEKLILPQLDPSTTPRNLISEMPRFKEEGDFTRVDTPSEPPPSPLDSIPVAIPKERTASGAGLVPRLPAKQPDKVPEPVTRPKPATQQRVKTATGKNVLVRKVEDPTKPIELQKLERQIELSKATGEKTKEMPVGRLPPVPPGADPAKLDGPGEDTIPGNVTPVVAKAAVNTVPSRATPAAGKPVIPRIKQPTPAQPQPIAIAKPKPAPALIVVEEHEEEVPAAARPRPKTAPPQPPPKPQQLPTEEIEPLEADELETIERARASIPQLSDSAIVLEEPDGSSLDQLLPAERPPTPAPPARAPTAPAAKPRPPTAPPPPPPDEPKPRPRPITAKPIGALVDLPLPASADLPAGTFDYKVKRSKLPLVLGVLLLIGAAIGGVILFGGKGKGAAPADAAEVAQVDQPTPDAAAVEPPPPADAEDEIEMEPPVDAAPRPRPITTQRPTTPVRPTTPTTPTTPTNPTTPPEVPPDAAVVAEPDPGCDEPTCVIEKYARPCCAKYKPTGEGFTPGNTESLDKPQIRAGIDRMRPAISRCGEQHPAKGTVKVSVSVNGEGLVERATLLESPDGQLGQCVVALVKKATFAKTTNGGSFTYPFAF